MFYRLRITDLVYHLEILLWQAVRVLRSELVVWHTITSISEKLAAITEISRSRYPDCFLRSESASLKAFLIEVPLVRPRSE